MNSEAESNFQMRLDVMKTLRPFRQTTAIDLILYSQNEINWRYESLDPLVVSAIDLGKLLYAEQQGLKQ